MGNLGGNLGGFSPLPVRLGGSQTEGLVASQHARMCADAVALSRTAPWAWVTFAPATEFTSPSVIHYGGMSGIGTKFRPLLTEISTTHTNVVWSPVHDDAYEVAEPLAIRHAVATGLTTDPRILTCSWNMGESNVIVITFDNTGSEAASVQQITLSVW